MILRCLYLEKSVNNLEKILDDKTEIIAKQDTKIILLNSNIACIENNIDSEIRKHKENCECTTLKEENSKLKNKIITLENQRQKLSSAEEKCEILSQWVEKLETMEKNLKSKEIQCNQLELELKALIQKIGKTGDCSENASKNESDESDDSYFCNKLPEKPTSNIVNNSTPIKTIDSESSFYKDMLQAFKEEMGAERAATLETHRKGLSSIQKSMNSMVSGADLQRVVSTISTTLSATDIRQANGAGLYKISMWIKDVEKATKDEEARRSMLWLKADSSVANLLGGEEKTSSFTWEEINKKN